MSMVYYGLTLNIGKLYGNFYINYFLNSAAEFPGYTLCIFLLNRVGRRKLHSTLVILAGLTCISGIFPVLYGTKGKQIIIIISLHQSFFWGELPESYMLSGLATCRLPYHVILISALAKGEILFSVVFVCLSVRGQDIS